MMTHAVSVARKHAVGLTIAALALAGGGTAAFAAGAAGGTGAPGDAAKGVGEAAVDVCRAQLPAGTHGLGKCVSAYVHAHKSHSTTAPSGTTEGKSDSSSGQGAEGRSDSTHGQASTHRH